jgi:hypothetical protein
LSNCGLISGAFSEQSAHSGGIDLSSKGDLHGYSSANARIPISTNNFSLLCASGETLGLKWAASPTSILSAQSDILYASSANTLARLAKGTAEQVLAMNSGATAPEWVDASAGGATLTEIAITGATANQTTTSTSAVSPSGTTSATLSNISGGKVMGILYSCSENTGVGAKTRFFIKYDSAEQAQVQTATPISQYVSSQTLGFTTDLDGGTIEIMWEVSASTGMIQNDVDASTAIIALEIS